MNYQLVCLHPHLILSDYTKCVLTTDINAHVLQTNTAPCLWKNFKLQNCSNCPKNKTQQSIKQPVNHQLANVQGIKIWTVFVLTWHVNCAALEHTVLSAVTNYRLRETRQIMVPYVGWWWNFRKTCLSSSLKDVGVNELLMLGYKFQALMPPLHPLHPRHNRLGGCATGFWQPD